MTADTATGFLALYVSYNIRYHLIQFAPYELSRFFNSKLLPLSEYFLYFLILSPFWIVFLMLTQRLIEAVNPFCPSHQVIHL